MTVPDQDANQLKELKNIIQHTISMEMRVKNEEVDAFLKCMEGYGFKFKNSWPSMELPEYTVIDFWQKELIK